MNSSATQNIEDETIMCLIHNNEIIAVDIDSSITGVVTYLCSKCLVDRTNNNKVSTIIQAKEQIASYKKQRQQQKKNEIQLILEQLKILFKNIEQFKCKVNTILQKISNELTKQINLKSQELSLSEVCFTKSNFQEDIKLLSEFVSKSDEQKEFQYINEMLGQFQQISVDIDYLETIEAFKNSKKIIFQFNANNQIQLDSQKIENITKTLSLSTLCKDHNKEVILIDIDSENIQTEKRLACILCFSNGSSQKYKTIEQINEIWINKKCKLQQNTKKQIKQKKLNEQIALIKRKYYEKLNLINEAKFFQQNTQASEISKFKQITIQQLSYDKLLSIINDLAKKDKEKVSLYEYKITKDMEGKLDQIKQEFQLDIQNSINFLNDQSTDNQIQEIIEELQKIQANQIIQQEKEIRIQELNEFKSSSNQLYCQMKLLNQTKNYYLEHVKKLNSIQQYLAVVSNHYNITNLNQKLENYVEKFEKDFQNLKKYCGIDVLIESLQLENQNIVAQLENQMKGSIEAQATLIMNLESRLEKIGLNLYLMQFLLCIKQIQKQSEIILKFIFKV